MSTRNLRHKTVPVYDNDDEVQDEIDGKRTYSVQDKLSSNKYNGEFLLDLQGQDLTFERIQRVGLTEPIRIKNKDGLGIIIPDDSNFGVSDVRACVGGRRLVDVMDCKTQRALEMPMRDFERYFKGSDRTHIYNVISLEFSQSRLENMVKRPTVVDNLDWIDLVWPQHLKSIQTDQTNKLHSMKYPKVQKYCLMSVAGCYTDYHIDFGGTSVWYHILQGGKIFWLIPPTPENLALYERWTRSGNQGDVFFGDIVPSCQRVEIEAGNSLMIPSGWIHAVYTPKDSIVFGGNFLNSFNIPMQLRISQLEEKLKVPSRFRFPFFTDVLWYALERYTHTLMGKSHLSDEFKARNLVEEHSSEFDAENVQSKPHVHITPFEYKGIKRLIEALISSYKSDSNSVPEGIVDPENLIETGKDLLRLHSDDDSQLAVTGKPNAYWPISFRARAASGRSLKAPRVLSAKNKPPAKEGVVRTRKVRCRQCVACLSVDCRECSFCRDMKKYGGPGVMKQTCKRRKCLNPLHPAKSLSNALSTENGSPMESTDDGKRVLPCNGSEILTKKAKLSPGGELGNALSTNSPLPSIIIPRVSDADLIKYSNAGVPENEQHLFPSPLDHYKSAWISIFKYLSAADLRSCALACSKFSEWAKLMVD